MKQESGRYEVGDGVDMKQERGRYEVGEGVDMKWGYNYVI